MKLTILTVGTILASTSFVTATPVPDGSQPNRVPVRWNDVEAGVHAVHASILARNAAQKREVNAHAIEHKHGLRPGGFKSGPTQDHGEVASAREGDGKQEKRDPEARLQADPGRKSGAENGGYRGGSGLWSREPKGKMEGGGERKYDAEKIEYASVFDESKDHADDPSWG